MGILAVDEEPEDVTVRLAQLAGFTIADLEERKVEVLRGMVTALETLPIRLYDGTHTIESAGADLHRWAAAEGRPAALFIDSIQKARCEASAAAVGPREAVEANVVAMRAMSTMYRMLVLSTSEANRSSYRSVSAVADTNDLAAGAESREIEFTAQTLLVLRTPREDPGVVHVRVAKNRGSQKGQFWLRMNFERHTVRECDDPKSGMSELNLQADPNHASKDVLNARKLATILQSNPGGLTARALRGAVREAGIKMGAESMKRALNVLLNGLDGSRAIEQASGRAKIIKITVDDDSDEHLQGDG